MLMHALEVLCNEPWCCILCWQFDVQFSYATHLAHPVLCRPTHFNISGYASGPKQTAYSAYRERRYWIWTFIDARDACSSFGVILEYF